MQCLKEKVAIPFPENAFKSENNDQVFEQIFEWSLSHVWAHLLTFQLLFLKVTGVEKAVYQTLEHINAVFKNCSDPDQFKEEEWNHFRGLVHRQIDESRCVRQEHTWFS